MRRDAAPIASAPMLMGTLAVKETATTTVSLAAAWVMFSQAWKPRPGVS